jgi:glucose-6-phosphate 1-epimerase
MRTRMTVRYIPDFAHLNNHPCWLLCFENAQVVISVKGGQVLSYQDVSGYEHLWLSPTADTNGPIRGGIPICWPRFGESDLGHHIFAGELPKHGLVRTQLWEQYSYHETDLSNTLSLCTSTLSKSGELINLFYHITLSAESLFLKLESPSDIIQQAALHTYLNVPSIHDSYISGLSDNYFDALNQQTVTDTNKKIAIQNEVDRIYFDTPAEIILSNNKKFKRTIIQSGHDSTVIWNPWISKSKTLRDMPDEGYLNFVCIETSSLDTKNARPITLQQVIKGFT